MPEGATKENLPAAKGLEYCGKLFEMCVKIRDGIVQRNNAVAQLSKLLRVSWKAKQSFWIFRLVCCVLFFPTLSTLIYSLFKWNGISDEIKFVRLKNYVDLFTTNSTFQISVINTLIYTVFVVVVQNSLALLIATLIYRESRMDSD